MRQLTPVRCLVARSKSAIVLCVRARLTSASDQLIQGRDQKTTRQAPRLHLRLLALLSPFSKLLPTCHAHLKRTIFWGRQKMAASKRVKLKATLEKTMSRHREGQRRKEAKRKSEEAVRLAEWRPAGHSLRISEQNSITLLTERRVLASAPADERESHYIALAALSSSDDAPSSVCLAALRLWKVGAEGKLQLACFARQFNLKVDGALPQARNCQARRLHPTICAPPIERAAPQVDAAALQARPTRPQASWRRPLTVTL